MAVTPEDVDRFHVRFDELAQREAKGRGWGARGSSDSVVLVDPYLIGRAIVEAMDACRVRTASGRTLLWNEYLVVLSRDDFHRLGPLARMVSSDLRLVLQEEVRERSASLIGELRVQVVADESDELEPLTAVIRASFSSLDRGAGPDATVLHEPSQVGGISPFVPGEPGASAVRAPSVALEWSRGRVRLPAGTPIVVGRPHASAPAAFVSLEGASNRINKQHLSLLVQGDSVTITRLPNANPVEVDGQRLPPGGQVVVRPPSRLSLSKGDLQLALEPS